MSKVSIGIRGWRFEEDVVFDEEGDFRELAEMPDDTRNRLIRLSAVLGEPCSACWILHGDEGIEQCRIADVVYGEPLAEVVLCDEHEADFVYWFREEGGSEYAGLADLREEFHEWFADGGRAPDDYQGVEHVDREPDALPDATAEGELEAVEEQADDLDEAEQEALDLDFDDLDV